MKEDIGILRQIVLNSPHYIFWKDIDLKYKGCNYSFIKSIGFNHPKDIIGKTDHQLPWSKECANEYQKEDKEVINTGKPILNKKVRIHTTNANGLEKIFYVSKVPLYDDNNKIIGVLGNCLDITEQEFLNQRLINESKITAEFLKQVSLNKIGKALHSNSTKDYIEALCHYYDSIIGCMPG